MPRIISKLFGPISHLWRLRDDVRRYRWHLVVLGLLSAAVTIPPLVTPQLTRGIIDIAYPDRDFRLLWILSGAMVAMNLVAAIMKVLSGYLSIHVDNLVAYRIRMRVFYALHRVPIPYLEGHQAGMFLERVSLDATRTAGMLNSFIPSLISLVVTTLVTVVMMVNISPLVTGLVLAIMPLYYILNGVLANKLRGWGIRIRGKDEQITSMSIEAIQGVPTARLFGAGKWLKAKYTGLLREKIKMAIGMWRTSVLWGQLSWGLAYGWGITLILGGWFLVFNDSLKLGEAVALGMYIPLIFRPVDEAIELYSSLITSSVAAQRVAEVIDAGLANHATPRREDLTINHQISMNDLSFVYPNGSFSLKNMTLGLKRGETVVIMGPTGSGKTTLLRILAGMYDSYDGEVTVDGVSLSRINPNDYLGLVAMVMADNFFFSGSILENLKLAGPDVSEEEVRRSAGLLGIDTWMETLPRGYLTPLGVDGVSLSSGQIQKIAILRALLKKPGLLLLDEITSAMDVESEDKILDGLRLLVPENCVTVMTTHRPAITLRPWVDRVIMLDDGAIVEEGAPVALFSEGTRYRKVMELAGIEGLLKRETDE